MKTLLGFFCFNLYTNWPASFPTGKIASFVIAWAGWYAHKEPQV